MLICVDLSDLRHFGALSGYARRHGRSGSRRNIFESGHGLLNQAMTCRRAPLFAGSHYQRHRPDRSLTLSQLHAMNSERERDCLPTDSAAAVFSLTSARGGTACAHDAIYYVETPTPVATDGGDVFAVGPFLLTVERIGVVYNTALGKRRPRHRHDLCMTTTWLNNPRHRTRPRPFRSLDFAIFTVSFCAPPAPSGRVGALESLDADTMRQKSLDVIGEGLEEIRRRRRFVWIVFFLFIPVVLLAHVLFGDLVARYVGLSWMGLFAFVGMRVGWSRCPSCGERFHSTGYWHNPWTQKCLHCRLHL
jgi:hypothetical protein